MDINLDFKEATTMTPTRYFLMLLTTMVVLTAALVSPPNPRKVLADDADSNPAMTHPDKFAWKTFVEINHSGGNGTNDTVWETWALQDDVYKDPNQKPVFPGIAHQPLRLQSSAQLEVFRERRKAMAP